MKKDDQNWFTESHFSEFNLANGRLAFFNKTFIPGGIISCEGNSLLTEEYPRLSFQCFVNIKDKQKFLKKFIPSKKINKDSFNLNINGTINLLNKKINFDKISIGKKYIAKEEDLIFFKESFERILLDESFFNVFKMNKIKEFFLEVI